MFPYFPRAKPLQGQLRPSFLTGPDLEVSRAAQTLVQTLVRVL